VVVTTDNVTYRDLGPSKWVCAMPSEKISI
jgi:hypothetical protein